jgi:hypothetical protein
MPLRALNAATRRSPAWTPAGRAKVSDVEAAPVEAAAALTKLAEAVESSSAIAGTATTIAPRIAHVTRSRARETACEMAAFMPFQSTLAWKACPLYRGACSSS